MKAFAHLAIFVLIAAAAAACDPQSGITKKSLEKFESSPTPEIKITPEAPIDPADVATVDVNTTGPNITVNGPDKKSVDCNKYNKLMVNSSSQKITVKGVCKQLMINGDRNEINGGAFTEIVFNGDGNKVEYSKYANGKRPIVADNTGSNTAAKAAAPESSTQKPAAK